MYSPARSQFPTCGSETMQPLPCSSARSIAPRFSMTNRRFTSSGVMIRDRNASYQYRAYRSKASRVAACTSSEFAGRPSTCARFAATVARIDPMYSKPAHP